MNAPIQTSQRRETLARAVDHFKARVDEAKRAIESGDDTGQSHERMQQLERNLDEYSESLKAARARLRHFDSLDSQAIETEIAQLRADSTEEKIRAALETLKADALQALLARMAVWVRMMQVDVEFRDRLRRAQRLENELMSAEQSIDFNRQAGFTLFRESLAPLDVLLAELERLANSAGSGVLHAALSRDARGQLLVAGVRARDAISMAGL